MFPADWTMIEDLFVVAWVHLEFQYLMLYLQTLLGFSLENQLIC